MKHAKKRYELWHKKNTTVPGPAVRRTAARCIPDTSRMPARGQCHAWDTEVPPYCCGYMAAFWREDGEKPPDSHGTEAYAGEHSCMGCARFCPEGVFIVRPQCRAPVTPEGRASKMAATNFPAHSIPYPRREYRRIARSIVLLLYYTIPAQKVKGFCAFCPKFLF